jgi:low affinity Fe/Cu permease
MKKPVGALPAPLKHLDDIYLDLQMVCDSQVTNTADLLEKLDEFMRDGRIDREEFAYIRRHVLLEHTLNRDAESLITWGRRTLNQVVELFQKLRAQVQSMKKAARQSGLHQPEHTSIIAGGSR